MHPKAKKYQQHSPQGSQDIPTQHDDLGVGARRGEAI